MEYHKQRASEAFFGRRQGKTLRDGQILRAETLLPQLKINLLHKAPKNLSALFSHKVEKVRLEIGFGGGEHLLHEMARFPDVGFIGVEPFINGMAKFLKGIEGQEQRLAHIRLYDDDATALLDWLPDNSLDGIDLFYPDPWTKKKHWKRRFVSKKNLDRFARVLKTGAKFRFASDIDHYVNWTLMHVERNLNFDWQAETAKDWQTPYEAWPSTRYEAKALREGRTPHYLTFVKL